MAWLFSVSDMGGNAHYCAIPPTGLSIIPDHMDGQPAYAPHSRLRDFFEHTLLVESGKCNTLFQKMEQRRRGHERIRAQIRKNPRGWAIERSPRPAAVVQIPRAKSGSSSSNVTQTSARRQRPRRLYRKFRSDTVLWQGRTMHFVIFIS